MNILRLTILVLGILVLLLGSWWILQGTGVVPIGFMAHQMAWAWRGAGLAVVGLIAVVISRRI
jgi:hypothetical protein